MEEASSYFRDEQRRNERGQGMVEFAILLFLVMALCAGMIYVTRTLSFQYWAQQEARFLAFEQTWVPHWASSNPEANAIALLDDDQRFRRPRVVSRLDKTRTVEGAGSVSDLLPFFAPRDVGGPSGEDPAVPQPQPPAPDEDDGSSDDESSIDRSGAGQRATQFAMKKIVQPSWLTRMLADDEDPTTGSGQKDFSLVRSAYASLAGEPENSSGDGISPNVPNQSAEDLLYPDEWFVPETRREKVFVDYVSRVQFGESLCARYLRMMSKHGINREHIAFSHPACARKINTGFGVHIGRTIDYPELFRSYEGMLERGMERGAALEQTVEQQTSQMFFSFFDTIVRGSRAGAPAFVTVGRTVYLQLLTDASISRMISEMRYVGSRDAVTAVRNAVDTLRSRSATNRSRTAEKAFEDAMTAILHDDADDGIPGVSDGFSFSATLFPIPPSLSPAAGGLQSGVMRNVLSQDTDLFDEQIDNSNKRVEVVLEAERGLFAAARRRFRTENVRQRAKFFLITQPWHVTRRESAQGSYRGLGDEFSSIGDSSYEGVLRRRVLGLWLFPKRPTALLDPITQIPGFTALDSAVSSFGFIDDFLSEVAGLLADNPARDLGDALARIPGLGSLVPRLPQFPAVRPLAYPTTQELTGDTLMDGPERNFQDYIDEQRDFSSRGPNPSFN